MGTPFLKALLEGKREAPSAGVRRVSQEQKRLWEGQSETEMILPVISNQLRKPQSWRIKLRPWVRPPLPLTKNRSLKRKGPGRE